MLKKNNIFQCAMTNTKPLIDIILKRLKIVVIFLKMTTQDLHNDCINFDYEGGGEVNNTIIYMILVQLDNP
jgi:hypothetical protein